LFAVACFLPGRDKDLSAPRYVNAAIGLMPASYTHLVWCLRVGLSSVLKNAFPDITDLRRWYHHVFSQITKTKNTTKQCCSSEGRRHELHCSKSLQL